MSVNQNHRYRIFTHFSICQDPRQHRIRHQLIDIIVIIVLATLCGEEGWEDCHDWAEDNQQFLREFLSLENGIPCPDTLRRVVERLDPDRFLEAFLSWSTDLSKRNPGQINIDGKSLRKALNEGGALHLVSAFAVDSGITIGCTDAGGKGKEIPAIQSLLNTLVLKVGDVVTIDAIGCQKDITSQIKSQKADYLIALKKNQGNLWGEADNFFTQAFVAEDYAPVSTIEIKNHEHGRNDLQKIWVVSDLEWLETRDEWTGLSSLVCVQREWTDHTGSKTETRFYISSLVASPERFSELIRRHWAIENEYHWHLDVTFREDDSEIGARSNKILRVARTIALQLLKAEPTKGMSIIRKKKRCHRSQTFLHHVLTIGNF